MVVPIVAFKPPYEGEVRASGIVLYANGRGDTVQANSCRNCAMVVGVMWQSALFEGSCVGCEVILSGAV